MFGPGDLIRLPADAVNGVLRLVDEVVRVRMLVEDTVDWLQGDVEQLNREVAHMRERLDRTDAWLHEDVNELKAQFAHVRVRVDELADSAPTRGPVDKVKDALTPG